MKYIIGILITAVLFLLLTLLLAARPKVSKKITVGTLVFAGICGFLIYSYGYLVITGNFVLAILNALIAVVGSFIGNSQYADLASVPIMNTAWMQLLCAVVQLCALYTTVSAVITALGTEALNRLRLWFSRRQELHLIYGAHEDAFAFGRDLMDRKPGIVLFVAESADSPQVSSIGCGLQADHHALNADSRFLRRLGLGPGKRSLTLYALEKNSTANIRYSKALLQTASELNIRPEQLKLVILSQEELAVSQLQTTPEQYGYGFVSAVNEPQMAARLLVLHHPPCETICFDADGKALEDFEALLIGFGQTGQAVLKALVMNGQFEGSHFRTAVFSPDCKNTDGSFTSQFPQLCEKYDISFHDSDGRSRKLYEYLRSCGNKLKYIAICTGCEKTNHEIAEELAGYFSSTGHHIPIFSCSHKGVDVYALDGTVICSHKLYRSDVLCSSTMDQMAMILNHRYQAPSDRSPLQNWMLCDYISRQSCRAAADFVPAVLRAAGKTREQVLNGDWLLTDMQKENLSKTEHLRWCAFHYCIGFSPMESAEFEARSEIYRQQIKQHGKASIRISKNVQGRTHACLVPWDELELLSQKEAAVTGKFIDYKAMDTENVMATPQLLQQAAQV